MNEWKANISEQTLKFNQVKKRNCGNRFLIINALLEIFLSRICLILKLKWIFKDE
jgi:hypothetical protein